MFSGSEDVEADALFKRGWSISAIARHLDRDRKTVRSYVKGDRVAGVRATSAPDPLAPFAVYVSARFVDDPHLWATALFDEVEAPWDPRRLRPLEVRMEPWPWTTR